MPSGDEVTNKSEADLAISILLNLVEDYHDFNPDTVVPVYLYPTNVQFSQQVARARPCVYRLDQAAIQTEAILKAQANGNSHGDGRGEQRESHPLSLNHKSLDDDQRVVLSAPCFQWTRRRLCELIDGEVEVAVTPDGRADSLYALPRATYADDPCEQVFVQPATTHMTMSNLLDELCPPHPISPNTGSPNKPVYYLQSQDSNLSRPELSPLVNQLPATPPPFALPTLRDPEATNIWIGNAQSVTSTHRDPYENLYLVVKGRKKFVLYAPIEEICLHAQMVRTGKWTYDEESRKFDVVMDDVNQDENSSNDKHSSRIPWIPIDPLNPPPASSTQYPYYKHARPLTLTVNEGEILYLPAGWFHHVSQECGQWEAEDGTLTAAPCIAVNYWFDMDYGGERHVMREMVGRLVEKVRLGHEVTS
ncbi:hypothetical protein H2200_009725 [Cladophialophora chaetospira]|uniref:JmjC domain-containing protein n=1 Tax=Cladophialophora chaetospira TaxID=386627 RepID=A0AA38X2Z3_9EURO|nr:hypothetical protein H2200_009725 [Cladophialophora chaetospira]